LKGCEVFGFILGQSVFDDAVDARASRAAAQADAKLVKVAGVACRHDFNIAILGVAHPSAQLELCGLALDKPAEADALHAALNEEMKNHGDGPKPVLQMRASARKQQ